MENNNSFHYTYSAPEQEEIRKIREKYMPKPEEADKMEQLRRLDKSVQKPGTICALILGVAGTLIFGAGMCCVMVWNHLIAGIVVGILGMIILGIAYPIYKAVTEKRKAVLGPQILKLTEELEKTDDSRKGDN